MGASSKENGIEKKVIRFIEVHFLWYSQAPLRKISYRIAFADIDSTTLFARVDRASGGNKPILLHPSFVSRESVLSCSA